MQAVLQLKERRLQGKADAGAGLEEAIALSDCVDLAIRQIWETAEGPISGCALVAIGGYGRRQMCPQSDIDLLVLHARRTDVTEPVRNLSYALWDTGFALGLLTATEKEAHRLAAADFDTKCACLDARLVYGDEVLFEDFRTKNLKEVRRSPERFAGRLLAVSEDRWSKAGEAGAELEPDLKRSKGALRDIAALGWIAAATGAAAESIEPPAHEQGLDLLLAVRRAMHLETGRPSDLLSMQIQIPVARRLGLDEYELMRRLYESCRPVAFAVDAALVGPDPLAPLVQEFAGAFLGPEQQSDTEWPAGAREAFLAILRAGPGGRQAFRSLDVLGALSAALPGWQGVRHLAQRNIYHRWSVDVHCFETVCELVRLESSDDDLLRQVASDCRKDRDSLLVAGLLHDIGKGQGEDHSALGERLADACVSRMGILASAGRDVVWLVRNHLLLAQVATRRDISEESLIVDLAERVGSERRLRMLYLLSVADAKATGPSAWTPWKADLVSQLFFEVNHLLERKELVGGDASRKAGERASEIRAKLTGRDAPSVDEHLATMPRAWLLSQTQEALVRQSKLMLDRSAGPVRVDARPEGEDGLWEVTVIAPDRPGLFREVSGVLALHGCDVVSAQIFTREDGLALEIFHVEAALGNDHRFNKVADDVNRALGGDLSLQEALSRKRSHYAGRVQKGKQEPPEVKIDNRASDFYTVIEVHATDRIGLLYEVTSALAGLEVDIHLAKVATYGEDVVDSFYVRDLEGQKVTDPERLRQVETKILAALSAQPDSI